MSAFHRRGSTYDRYFRESYSKYNDPDGVGARLLPHCMKQQFGAHLPARKDSAILDFAAGTGQMTRALGRLGYTDVTAVDISKDQVDAAARLGINVLLEDGAEHCRSHVGQYDCILASDLIEHLTRDEGVDLLADMAVGLAPNGVIILRTPNASGPFVGRARWRDLTHEIAYTGESLHMLLSLAGLETVDIYGRDPVGPGLRGAAQLALRSPFRAVQRLYAIAEWGVTEGREFPLDLNLIAVARRPANPSR